MMDDSFWSEPLRCGAQEIFVCLDAIDAAGAARLGQALLENTTLQQLNVDFNEPFGPEGAEGLLKPLHKNNTLKLISLIDNQLADDGAKHVAAFLTINKSVTSLNLGLNNITGVGAKALAQALITNQKSMLKELDMSENPLGDGGAVPFAKALYYNNRLNSLDLGECNTGEKDSRAFENALSVNEKLVKLVMGDSKYKSLSKLISDRLERNNLAAKREFLKAMKSNDKGPWNRSKLMFVGQGRAGKTSTVRSLLGEKFNPEVDSTIGASLTQTETAASLGKWKVKVKNNFSTFQEEVQARAAMKRIEDEPFPTPIPQVQKPAKNKASKPAASKAAKDAKTPNKRESKKPATPAKPIEIEEEPEEPEGIMISIDDIPNEAPADRIIPTIKDNTANKKSDEELYANAQASKDTIVFSLWDYGGQKVFYSLHHLFLTKYGIYILVFDMRNLLGDAAVGKEYLEFWLNSVALHAPDAPLIIVGTCLDKLKDSKNDIVQINETINSIFEKRRPNFFVENRQENLLFYPVDNTSESGTELLRIAIEQISKDQAWVRQEVALRWLGTLDEMLFETGGKDGKAKRSWLRYDEVKVLASHVGLTDPREVDEMLSLFHELGVLVHLTQTEKLKNIVTLQPQWLVDALCKVVRDKKWHPYDYKDIEVSGLTNDLKLLQDKALASRDILEYFWRNTEAEGNVDFMLDLMRQMILVSDWDFGKEKMFVVPILYEIEDAKSTKVQNESDDYVCVFDFSDYFLPIGVFERLVCLCVSHSSSVLGSKIKTSPGRYQEPELHKDWALIWMGVETRVSLRREGDQIYLGVNNASMARKTYDAFLAMLSMVNGNLMGRGLQYASYFGSEKIRLADAEKEGLGPWFDGKHQEKSTIADEASLDDFIKNL